MWLVLGLLFCGDVSLVFPQQRDIRLTICQSPGYRGKVVFFAPHEDEHVVNAYLAEKVQNQGGRFLVLHQNGTRHITLAVGRDRVEVDPNRIFTKRGARASVLALNDHLKKGSRLYARSWRRAYALGRFILKQIKNGQRRPTIVAIHNNTEGFDDDGAGGIGTVSIHRYQKKLAAGARYIKALHVGSADEDDLFFITEPDDFEAMKTQPWHIVLQHPRVARLADEDDGSLSVLSEKKGWRYINIEAQRKPDDDHLQEQMRMVDFVFDLVQP